MEEGKLKNDLATFQSKLRQERLAGTNSVDKMHELFVSVAERLLCGGYFEVSSGDEVIRRVFPFTVEFYYHEEGKGEEKIKDYIVYHRNSDNPKKEPLKTFQINTLHTHLSGIDLTFEGEDEKGIFRASALIRAYQVIDGGEGFPALNGENPKASPYSTYLYDNLFMGIDIEKGIQVKWKNLDWNPGGHLHNGYRFNVCEYDDIQPSKPGEWEQHVKKTKKNHPKLSPDLMQDKKPWAFSRGVFSGLCEK